VRAAERTRTFRGPRRVTGHVSRANARHVDLLAVRHDEVEHLDARLVDVVLEPLRLAVEDGEADEAEMATMRPKAVQFIASEMPSARMRAFWLGSTLSPETAPKLVMRPDTVPRSPRASRGSRGGRGSPCAWRSGDLAERRFVHRRLNLFVGRFTFTRPAWTMRASGAFAAEHILTAFATSPARMHFCIVARNTSLLMDEPTIQVERALDDDPDGDDRPEEDEFPSTSPSRPSLKCFHTAAAIGWRRETRRVRRTDQAARHSPASSLTLAISRRYLRSWKARSPMTGRGAGDAEESVWPIPGAGHVPFPSDAGRERGNRERSGT
jgi:hypothetical protein